MTGPLKKMMSVMWILRKKMGRTRKMKKWKRRNHLPLLRRKVEEEDLSEHDFLVIVRSTVVLG